MVMFLYIILKIHCTQLYGIKYSNAFAELFIKQLWQIQEVQPSVGDAEMINKHSMRDQFTGETDSNLGVCS